MINAGDTDALNREKVHLKLLRLASETQRGFVLTDFPSNVAEAEQLETYKGGLNAFVHISLPDDILIDIEENKYTCNDCGTHYYRDEIHDAEYGIHIDPFVPKDGCCVNCGSSNIGHGSDPK